MKKNIIIAFIFIIIGGYLQGQDSTSVYKKRVLENIEFDFLASYYSQTGDNAAVSGGTGTEELTDIAPVFVVSIPINADDVLTIDAGISAYTSASSSNVNPFDGNQEADPFQASTGASEADTWANLTASYSHSSDDRNKIISAKVSLSSEYDYSSFGFGAGYTQLFNEKNTEISFNTNVYIDSWSLIYPTELRPFSLGGSGINSGLFNNISGNADYAPSFSEFSSDTRNSYSVGLGFSQILSKNMQGSLAFDYVYQDGLLSTPFQRVYFSDVADSFIENFQLADDIERLPSSRSKVAVGGRLNYFINEIFLIRTYYRYYTDDWGINSHTASIEIPIKLAEGKFTLYPSYRFYNQSAADYFAPYEGHLSTAEFYTSDYDLSKYNANQFGLGFTYTDIFTSLKVWKIGLKSVDVSFNYYERDSGLKAFIIAAGLKFVIE